MLAGLWALAKEGAYQFENAGVINELRHQGFKNIESNPGFLNHGGLDRGVGPVTYNIARGADVGFNTAKQMKNAVQEAAGYRGGGNQDNKATDMAYQNLKKIPGVANKIQNARGINEQNNIKKGFQGDFYKTRAPLTDPFANSIPGSSSTQIKISSPTQAEQIAAGAQATRQPLSTQSRVKLGDKDMRSILAEEKLRVAYNLLGDENVTRNDLVDIINQPGVQPRDGSSTPFLEAFAADERVGAILRAGDEGYFDRPPFESSNFVGEGQFGRVEEFVPGYVVKKQAPLVEWGGYQEGSSRGSLIGRIHDYRDVIDEANHLNYLNKRGITPGVENLIVNDDGSSEMYMKDLRVNHSDAQKVYDKVADEENPQKKAQNLKDARVFELKRRKQEAAAAVAGLELADRPAWTGHNVMVHDMMQRPVQIDPSSSPIGGFDRDAVMAEQSAQGMRVAGLQEEADIFTGLVNEAIERGDGAAVHDLAQQGVSRLMKLKNVL